MSKSLTIIALALVALVSCAESKEQFAVIEGAMLGTTLRIVADIPGEPSELYNAVMELDSKFKSEMSLFDPSSLLSRINRGECDTLTPALSYNIQLSDSVSRLSGGYYDITVAPLVKALGFGAKGEQQQDPNIDSLLEFVGFQKISLDGNKLIKHDSRTEIDLNSIAKGYVVDKVAELTQQMGANNYLVDIGGEISCHGSNPHHEPWRIGIESPIDGNMTNGELIEQRIQIPADSPLRAMATSGNYRRFYLDEQGNKVAHTINPKDGHSALSTLLSVTVVAHNCALADAYSTMFMAVGSQHAVELSKSITNAEVYFIFANNNGSYDEYLSDGMKEFVMKKL
ncbi:MAG: FAD:protein FMN transferase [Rikenellaceae bacterium]